MPFGGLGTLGLGALGVGSSLAGLFGQKQAPSVGNVNAAPQYNFQNTAGADSSYYNTIPQLSNYNVAAQYLPQYQGIAQGIVNNPYANQFQGGAGSAADAGVQAGGNAFQAGGNLLGASAGMTPDVQALLSMGFDPQGALYSKLQQTNTDQTNASLASRGLSTTPYGAGVAADANNNFNLNWNNQALSRASQGASAAGGLSSSLAGLANTGAGLQSGAVGTIQGAAGIPYSTFNNINSNSLAALGQTGQFGASAAAGVQGQLGDYLSYLQASQGQQGANNQSANVGLNQANMQFGQNQTLGQNLGTGLASLSKGWNTYSNPALPAGAFMGS